MRVLLRYAHIGLYYAGPKHWVGQASAAVDLQTIEHAAELSRDENFDQMEIVVGYDDPACELVLPVRRRLPATKSVRGHARLASPGYPGEHRSSPSRER